MVKCGKSYFETAAYGVNKGRSKPVFLRNDWKKVENAKVPKSFWVTLVVV
jgi:hypothetical protein